MKKALITGITGQDGSYLAELLLDKGYEVHGMIRRSSSFNTDRIDHIYVDPHTPGARLFLHYGDLNDASSLNLILKRLRPDEIYNLGAQSHVRVSFDIPEYTGEVTALGATRLFEAVRDIGMTGTRIYQASSSEMFGASPPPQSEATPFYPRSPYAAAKIYAYWMAVNYREAYKLFVVNGILFNHECIAADSPLMVRQGGIVNVVTADELVPLLRKGPSVQTFEVPGLEVWDGERWTPVKAITATRRRVTDPSHQVLSVQARGGVVQATAHHRMLDAEFGELAAEKIAAGDRLALATSFPETPAWTALTPELAEFLGLMAAEGYVPDRHSLQFTNNDTKLRERVAQLWRQLFLGSSRTDFYPSGFGGDQPVGQLYLTGGNSLCEWLRGQLYTPSGHKRVPPLVLNARPEVQRAFLDGYYAGDGLKAGNGDSVKTNSSVLAQGLCWLYGARDRKTSVYVEHRGEASYYQLNIATANPLGEKGQHLRRDPAEVRKVEAAPAPSEWVFDLETGSGRFCAGVGRLIVHNSPRRGETFVTRKVTRAAARIKLGMQQKLFLGNLEARRDWGYAKDYVEAMWLALQQERPDDYVVATGESHSVRELCEAAFGHVGLDYRQHVETDPRYLRPTEVDDLRGDSTKAQRALGWKPRVAFAELIRLMTESDLALAERERRAGAGPAISRHG